MGRSGGHWRAVLAALLTAVLAVSGLVVTDAAAVSSSMPPAAVSFLGMGTTNTPTVQTGDPPSASGAAGPNHYVEGVNGGIEVWNKSGTVLAAAKSLNTLWTGYIGTNAGNACASRNDGDPVVRYDQMADRWIVSQFSLPNANNTDTGPSFQCVAVSKTADPTGAYWLYDFKYAYAVNDDAKIGVWPDAYYYSFDAFSTTAHVGAVTCAWDRAKMLLGQAATQQCFTLPYDANDPNKRDLALRPANLDGSVPPPAGSPEYFVEKDYSSGTATSSAIDVWKFHVDWATPANSTFTGPTKVSVDPYTRPCSAPVAGNCIPQLGSTSKIDAVGDRLSDRVTYRNFGTHESLLVTGSVAANTTSGIGWWELRLPNGSPTLEQQGVYAPNDGNWRWMPSGVMDQAGDILIGFSLSGSAVHPGMRWVGRLAGDPAGTMGLSEVALATGAAAAVDDFGTGRSRWGDYVSMTIDPTDDCSFWFVSEYYTTTTFKGWDTRVASARLPECGANDFSLSPQSSASAVQGDSTSDTIDTAVTAGSAESLALSVNGLPGGATADFSPASVNAGSSSTLTIHTASDTPIGDYPIEVIGTAPSAYHSASFTLSVAPNATPSCTDQAGLTTAVNTPLPVTLGCADSDSGDTLTYAVTNQPAHGSVGAPDSGGHVTYTPAPGYVGADSFTFHATDNHASTSPDATVGLTVGPNHSPACTNASVTVTHATAKSLTLPCGDADTGQPLTWHVGAAPAHGTLGAVSPTGHVTYTPRTTYAGLDSFTFSATDGYGGTSSTATMTVHVSAGRTTLSISLSRTKVAVRRLITVQGRLRDAVTRGYLNGQRVYLQTRIGTSGSWQTVTHASTSKVSGANGTVNFTVRSTRSRYYRLVFNGTTVYLRSHSTAAFLKVVAA
jgi:hypothetical protein